MTAHSSPSGSERGGNADTEVRVALSDGTVTSEVLLSAPAGGSLRVWWIPQIPGRPFHVPVNSTREARLVLDVLGRYDLFQLEQRIKPDYSNAGGLEFFEPGEGWCEWYDDKTGESIDEIDLASIPKE